MNPWGFLILGLGILLLIMGVTGSYKKVETAITGTSTTTTALVNTNSVGSAGSTQTA